MLLMMCPNLRFVTLSASAIGIRDSPNPFALPESDHADVVLLTAYWYEWLTQHHPDRVDTVMRGLDSRTDTIVGVDGADHFALSLPPSVIERTALVLKFQGLFKDRELYNYNVGPWYPGAVWGQKSRPKQVHYGARHLEKLRLSVPCVMLDLPAARRHMRAFERGATRVGRRELAAPERMVRDAAEAFLPYVTRLASLQHRKLDVHGVMTLTHVQRLEVMRLLEGFSGHRGIDATPRSIAGLYGPGVGIPDDVYADIVAQAARYLRPRLGRVAYLHDLCRHKIGVAPTGYGELTYRHGETLLAGAVLVCQDLSHVDMMFPLQDGANCLFCRHDLSDLREKVTELLALDSFRVTVAREGRRSFLRWAAQWRDHLRTGIEAHILAARQ